MTPFFRYTAIQSIVISPAPAVTQDTFFDSNGVRIRYVEQGSGQPMVLVHSFSSNIETDWLETGILQNLAKDYRVIALDCRGHGKSDKPRDAKQYGSHMGADIVRLLDHLDLRKAHIIGYSMGGSITAHLLGINPERFITATLGGSVGRLRWSSEDDLRSEKEAAEIEEGMLRSIILRLTPKNKPKPTEAAIRKKSEAHLADQDRQALAAVRRSYHNQAVTDAQMAAVKVPTLCIAGSVDPVLAKINVLEKVMPAIKVVVIEGAAHSGYRGAARRPEFVQAIRKFVTSRCDTPSP